MLPKEYDVSEKTVLITGGARGIGRGIVQVLAESGAEVLVTALTNRYLGPFIDEMGAAGHHVYGITHDATKASEMERVVDRAMELWGRLDVFINAVGDSVTKDLVALPGSEGQLPVSDAEWRYLMDINLNSAFLGCRAVGPYMLEQRKGKVINISSVAGTRPQASRVGYSAAKAGLENLTRALAIEWSPYGVTVNTISPGFFPDPILASANDLERTTEMTRRRVPLGRPGLPKEVGLLALYLVSDASNYMTGTTISLDGGLSLL